MFRFSADIVNIMNSNFIEIVLTLLDKVEKEYSDSKKCKHSTYNFVSITVLICKIMTY